MAAMHGYAPDHVDSTASLLMDAPSEVVPKRLDGLFHLMLSALDRL